METKRKKMLGRFSIMVGHSNNKKYTFERQAVDTEEDAIRVAKEALEELDTREVIIGRHA